MKIRIRSRIETLTEKLAQRTRITCASMPQALTEQQLHVLRFVVVKGRTPGGILALAALLGITRQAFSQFTSPLFLMGLIERVPVDGAAGGSANGNISQGRAASATGLIVTKRGAAYIAKVENAELTIEDCILERLTAAERNTFLQLLDKAVGDGSQEVEVA